MLRTNKLSPTGLLYIFRLLSYSDFTLPMLLFFYASRGLSFSEVMVLKSLGAITIVLCDIPTSLAADYFGRARVLLAGVILRILAMAGLVLVWDKAYYFVFEIIYAIGFSTLSGGAEALISDCIDSKHIKKTLGNHEFFGLTGLALSTVVGGVVAQVRIELPLILNAIIFTIATVPLLVFMSRYGQTQNKTPRKQFNNILAEYGSLFTHKNLVSYLLFGGMIYFFSKITVWTMQKQMAFIGFDKNLIGIVIAVTVVLTAIGAKSMARLSRWLGNVGALLIVLLSMLICAWILAMVTSKYLVAGYLFFAISRGVYFPLIVSILLSDYGATAKATIVSTITVFGNIIFVVLSPIIGQMVDGSGIYSAQFTIALFASACVCIFCSYFLKTYTFKEISNGAV